MHKDDERDLLRQKWQSEIKEQLAKVIERLDEIERLLKQLGVR
jgi:hypothetical protein